MATIAENLKTIKDSTTAIKQAIIDKGGEVGDLTTYADAIANLPSGGGDPNPTAEKNAVTFYDYDGTIRYSYTADEFLALAEMPPLPTQKGLICQEWNWSFEDAKEYVAEYGVLDVGATYITDDGKTRLYIRIAAEGRMDVPLYFQQTVANGVTIDWGDGSATETLSDTGNVNTTHRYASIGNYVISLDVADGCILEFSGTSTTNIMGYTGGAGIAYSNMLKKVEIGKNVTIGNFAFRVCYSLSSIVIPNTVTTIGSVVFLYNYSLTSVIFPQSITDVGSQLLRMCSSLQFAIFAGSLKSIAYQSFQECYCLSSIVMPFFVSSIGESLFRNCYSLSSIVFPNTSMNIASNAFSGCSSMVYYDFSRHTAIPTLANANAFTGISSDCKIIVPDALYDKWVSATNWSTYASYIIKKTDWNKLQQ
jgi:hypothetical protein